MIFFLELENEQSWSTEKELIEIIDLGLVMR